VKDLNVKIRADGRVTERRVPWEVGQTYDRLLELLDINAETVVALLDGHPVPTDDLVEPGDLEIVRVVSSG
jgi:sulfur carrier protein ThiS